jgi:endonuclease/exonuclease/phosphatase family metal-dependent hydrolase
MVSPSFTVAKAPSIAVSLAAGVMTMHRPVPVQSGLLEPIAGGPEDELLHAAAATTKRDPESARIPMVDFYHALGPPPPLRYDAARRRLAVRVLWEGGMAFVIATFNLKDFFHEPRDAFEAKVAWTAAMLREIDADVVAMQEVGHEETLDALVARLDGGYPERVVGSADARGIRCALVSRARVLRSAVRTTNALPFPRFVVGDAPPFGERLPLRRGVVHARVDAGAVGEVDVFVAHFKSRRVVPLRDAEGNALWGETALARAESEVRSMVWRSAEALFVRSLVDDVIAIEPAAKIVVAGDLNDVAGSPTLAVVQGRPDAPGGLANCADVVPAAQRFSILHRGERSAFDHLLVTAPLRARLTDARFVNEALREHVSVAADGTVPPTVDSDHAPFVARFV